MILKMQESKGLKDFLKNEILKNERCKNGNQTDTTRNT